LSKVESDLGVSLSFMLQDEIAVLRLSEAVRKWMSNITYRVIGALQVQVNEATA